MKARIPLTASSSHHFPPRQILAPRTKANEGMG